MAYKLVDRNSSLSINAVDYPKGLLTIDYTNIEDIVVRLSNEDVVATGALEEFIDEDANQFSDLDSFLSYFRIRSNDLVVNEKLFDTYDISNGDNEWIAESNFIHLQNKAVQVDYDGNFDASDGKIEIHLSVNGVTYLELQEHNIPAGTVGSAMFNIPNRAFVKLKVVFKQGTNTAGNLSNAYVISNG